MKEAFIDITFVNLNIAFRFIDINTFGFMIDNLPFKHELLLPVMERELYVVRCWVRPEDRVRLKVG